MLLQALLQFAVCIAIIFPSESFGKGILLEDEEIDIREPNEMTLRGWPEYQPFQQTKRDGVDLQEVLCGLYPAIVPIVPGNQNVMYSPQFVNVTRCQGACDRFVALKTCTPSVTRSIAVKVSTPNGGSSTRQVIEHVGCTCQCHVKCDDQIHNRDKQNCRCNCKTSCKADENQNPTTCKCTRGTGKRRLLH